MYTMNHLPTMRTAALLLIVTLFAGSAAAGPIRIAFRDTTVTAPAQFAYPLYADSALTGQNVTSLQMTITFSSNAVSIVGIEAMADCGLDLWGAPLWSVSGNTLTIAGAGSTPLSGTGRLFRILVQPKPSQYTQYASFSISNALFNEGTPAITVRNGNVTINAPPTITVSPETAVLSKGETQQFNVYGGTAPYTWSTTSAIATINSSGLLTAVSSGAVRVVCMDNAGIRDTSGIVEIRPARFEVRDTSVHQGAELLLPVYASGMSGENIVSGEFTLNYSPSLWQVNSVVTTGTLLAGSSVELSALANSKIKVAFAGRSSLAGSGVLCFIQLTASTEHYGYSYFSFESAKINEGVPAKTDDGTVIVQQLTTLNVQPYWEQNLVVGDSLQFTVSGGTAPYSWSVSDTALAAVSTDGWLTAKRGGEVIVTATDALGAAGESGVVHLFDFTVSIPDTIIHKDTLFLLPVHVSKNNIGFSAAEIEINYSTYPNIVPEAIVQAGTMSEGWSVEAVFGLGNLRIVMSGSQDVKSAGVLFYIRIRAGAGSIKPSQTYFNFVKALFNEGSPRAFDVDGVVRLQDRAIPAIDPGPLSFYVLRPGDSDTGRVKIRNLGNIDLSVGVNFPTGNGDYFYPESWAFNVAPGETAVAVFIFQPSSREGDTLQINFTTNDPYNSTVPLMLYGSVNRLPVLVSRTPSALDSVEISQSILFGVTVTEPESEAITYTWRVDGETRQTGSNHQFQYLFGDVSSGIRITAVFEDVHGNADSTEWNVKVVTEVSNSGGSLPRAFALLANYPNPFNPSTAIRFELPVRSRVTMTVTNILGEHIATIVEGVLDAGSHRAEWRAERVAAGLYFCRFEAEPSDGAGKQFVAVQKMVLLK